MASGHRESLLNQLSAQFNLNPSRQMILSPFANYMPPNPDFLKLLYGNNSFSALQANFNLLGGGQEPEAVPKTFPPLIPNPMAFGLKKPGFGFPDLLSKLDTMGGGINQSVSPASGMPNLNLIKEKMSLMMPTLMGNMARFGPQDDAEQASLNNRGFGMGFPVFPTNLMNRPKIPEKKVITIYDEDEDVVECRPEEFKKNIERCKEIRTTLPSKTLNIHKNNQQIMFQRKFDQKSNKRSIKSFISIDDSGPQDETKLKFFTTNNSMMKRNFFKKKTKKGFLSHRKKHRNQKGRREKIVLNCKKCTSRIVILTKKIQFTEHKIKDRLCKNCLAETLEKEAQEKKSNNLLQIANRYNTVPKKPKEEDTESKSETNSGYKDMMFSNTNRILIGEGYQAGMPEFLLNKPLKMQEFRNKTMELLKSNKVWNPSEENSQLYDEVYQMICSTFHGTYSHCEFVAMIDQYEGDIRLIKEKLEIKDVALFNLINESISTSGKKRVTRSSKNKFRRHDFSYP